MRLAARRNLGTTLPELMMAVLLVAGFFATIFEINAVCLHYINASKENMGAIEGVQDRLENLRSLNFSDLTSQTYMTTLITSPANTSPLAQKVTETVTIRAYPVVSGGATITYTRTPGATVTPSAVASGGSLSSSGLVRVDVKFDWALTLGGRSCTEETSTLIADGLKK